MYKIVLFLVMSTNTFTMEQEATASVLSQFAQKAGTSVTNFFKSIPDAVGSLPQLMKDSSSSEDSSEEGSSGSDTSPVVVRAIEKRQVPVAVAHLKESPPQITLSEDAVIGDIIPEMPVLFRIHNKTDKTVKLIAVLTHPFAPKKYVLRSTNQVVVMAPEHGQFEQVYIEASAEENRHQVCYKFKDALDIFLQVIWHPTEKNQFFICKRETF